MSDTIYDDAVLGYLEKHPPVACTHPILREMVAQPFDVASQIILKPTQPFHNTPPFVLRHVPQILFGFRLQLNPVLHHMESAEFLSER
jgi:hypothetical protein